MKTSYLDKASCAREEILREVKRVVVKVGSGVLTSKEGLNLQVIESLASDISTLMEKGVQVILVSSGAIASGLKKVGLTSRPKSLSEQQALAAIGQPSLMMAYEEAFWRYDTKVAQLLITRDDLNHRRRYLNARNTVLTLLSWDILPIFNENDTVVVDEIKFGDNDNLSAMVVNLTDAHLLIILTDMDGLFDKDPRRNPDARLIQMVERVDSEIKACANNLPGFLGTGGMASKIKAAEKVALAGVPTIIANGLKREILSKIFSGMEEGTLFLPRSKALCSRKHWIAFAKAPKGEIIIDKGAEKAIVERGKSLLPSGIVDVRGRFGMGDAVLLLNQEESRVAIGLVAYHSGDIKKIMGLKSSEIEKILGYKHDDEVVHRDNLVLMEQIEGEEICRLRN